MGSGVSSSMALALAGFCFTLIFIVFVCTRVAREGPLRQPPPRRRGPGAAHGGPPEVAEGDASGEESGRRDGFRQWVRGHLYCTPLMAGDESFRRSASSSTSWARRSLPSRPPPRSRCRISPSMAPPLSVASRSPLFASFASANAAAILCSVLTPAAALDLVLVVAGDLVGAVHPAAVHGGIGRHRARGDGDVQLCPEAGCSEAGPAPRMPVAGGPRRSMLSLITCSIRRH